MKKIISIILSLILALSMALTSFGLTASNVIISQTNEKNVAKYAEEFVKSIYETLDLQTGKVSVSLMKMMKYQDIVWILLIKEFQMAMSL